MAGARKKPRTAEQDAAYKRIRRTSRQSRNWRSSFEQAVRDGLATGLSLNDAAEAAEFKDNTAIRNIRDKKA